MKTNKLLVLLCLVFALSLTACGGNSYSADAQGVSAEKSDRVLKTEEVKSMFKEGKFSNYIGQRIENFPILMTEKEVIGDSEETYGGAPVDFQTAYTMYFSNNSDLTFDDNTYVQVSGIIEDAVVNYNTDETVGVYIRTTDASVDKKYTVEEKPQDIDARLMDYNGIFNKKKCKRIDYKKLSRKPDKFKGKSVKNTGRVIELIEGDDDNNIQVAIGENYDKVMLIGYDPHAISSDVHEHDIVTFYGTYMGIHKYKTAEGRKMSFPAVSAKRIKVHSRSGTHTK